MKKGFALLETIIVITFLSVSLLLLYKPFNSMILNSKKNVLYDDASNIYKVYYIKEYLMLNNLKELIDKEDIKKIDCSNFNFNSCNTLFKELQVSNIYISKYDLKEYNKDNYSSTFNNYIDTLSNKEDYKYRLIVEFDESNTYLYASIGLNGEANE